MNIAGGDHYQKASRRSVGELATASLAAFLITRRHQRGGGGALKPVLECGRKGSGAHTSLHPMTEGKYIHLCDGGNSRSSRKRGRPTAGFQKEIWECYENLTISVYYCLATA